MSPKHLEPFYYINGNYISYDLVQLHFLFLYLKHFQESVEMITGGHCFVCNNNFSVGGGFRFNAQSVFFECLIRVFSVSSAD